MRLAIVNSTRRAGGGGTLFIQPFMAMFIQSVHAITVTWTWNNTRLVGLPGVQPTALVSKTSTIRFDRMMVTGVVRWLLRSSRDYLRMTDRSDKTHVGASASESHFDLKMLRMAISLLKNGSQALISIIISIFCNEIMGAKCKCHGFLTLQYV